MIALSGSNYLLGRFINHYDQHRQRKALLIFGLIINIGVLVVFKYFNFFIDEFIGLFAKFGWVLQRPTLRLILPLGISFYIFLSISYIVDVYRKKLVPPKNISDVLLTLSFFPIILAGPIEKPIELLPQIQRKRVFDSGLAVDGLRQILWGLLSKIVIADFCAGIVDSIFNTYSLASGSTLLLGVILFAIQIYADFAGYSNIAIGVAKLFGFRIIKNFNYPYFSKNISDFWRRWHISLMNWFRDYIFLPLAYFVSKKIKREQLFFLKTDLFIYITGIIVTWFLTGLWHGANLTFILWGMIHGFFLILYQLSKKPRKFLFKKTGITSNSLWVILPGWLYTMGIVLLAWVFFRAADTHEAFSYLGRIFSPSLISLSPYFHKIKYILVVLFFFVEWLQRHKDHPLQFTNLRIPIIARWSIYYLIILLLLLFPGGETNSFIYFQF